MKLKLDYHRPAGGRVDLAITTDVSATVGDIAAELASSDPLRSQGFDGAVTLAVAPAGGADLRRLDPERTIGESQVASGWSARVARHFGGEAPAVQQDRAARDPLVDITVSKETDAGKRMSLPEGSYVIGRDPTSDIVLDDALVSRNHARLEVGPVIEIVDLKSANGIELDGERVGRLRINTAQSVLLGDTTLRIDPLRPKGLKRDYLVGAGVPFNRSPRIEVRYPGTQYPSPDVPAEGDKPPFPWALMVVPILMGAVSYVVTKGNPSSFIFVAMSPLMMLSNYVMGRKRSSSQRDTQIGIFVQQLSDLDTELGGQVELERAARLAEEPSPAEVHSAVVATSELMWTRRPEHWSFLHVRLGLGTTASRNTVAARTGLTRGIPRYAQQLDDLLERYRSIAGTPVVESPIESGALGIVGPADLAGGVARSVLVQLAGLHSPAEVVIAAMVGSSEAGGHDWLKWLPHTSSTSSPLTGSHLADSPTSAKALLSQLEELISIRVPSLEGRAAARPSMTGGPAAMEAGSRVGEETPQPVPIPAVVLFVTSMAVAAMAPMERARLVQMAEAGADAGIVVITMADHVSELPAVCRTFADASSGLSNGSVHFVRHGTVIAPVELDSVSASDATRFAHTMSPCFDQGAVVDEASDLPRAVPLISLLGADATATPAAVVERWRETQSLVTSPPEPREKASGLSARVGSRGTTDMVLDLRAQGPHAFIGGSTGSGKSEFLQSWILGLAAEYSPQRVTFLYVDFKASSAFEECVKLPHSVGLVTNLTPYLVLRALTSLRAELQTRQQVLLEKKAIDLIDLEKRGDPECPPALVIVIDEFAALVSEVPDFVDGVVDIAQRGRALGIHLVMATQRTAGVIKDSIRANANLRVALRMTEEADSQDVIGSPVAATFDPDIPGRGMAKTGPGRLTAFQSAFPGGRSDSAPPKPDIVITELRFGAEQTWKQPVSPRPETRVDRGPTDLVRLVETITGAAAHAGLAPPRRPWLDELEQTYNLAVLRPRADTELILGMSDAPKEQAQKPVTFRPDSDGHLVVYGTGGSGKTVLLRTLANGAGITPRGGPVQVYCLDFAAGGLRTLEVLPHVGAVIAGDDDERVARLFRTLKDELERRKRDYPANVDTVVAYRRSGGGRPDEPRILLLLDGYPAFHGDYAASNTGGASYATFLQLLAEGRRFGMHVVFTADRPGSVTGAVSSSVPRKVVLRLADDTMYRMLDVPKDVLSEGSPPGRAVIDGLEAQIAVLGGSPSTIDQEEATNELAETILKTGRIRAPGIAALPTVLEPEQLPREVAGEPVLGLADSTLSPIGFSPDGPLLIAGPPGSGRSNALAALTEAVARWRPDLRRYYLGARRSDLAARDGWTAAGIGPAEIAEIAKELTAGLEHVDADHPPVLVVIEAVGDLLGTEADSPTLELAKAMRRAGHLLIAESETSGWTGGWSAALLNEVKAARRGLLLQPDQLDGESLLRTQLPRIGSDEFLSGRAFYVNRGKVVKVQLPLVTG